MLPGVGMVPQVDVSETDSGIRIEAELELPRVDEKDVGVGKVLAGWRDWLPRAARQDTP
jgi:hypothetical protein